MDSDALRGVYVLGKAATLNADVGDVMISSVIHDEHSGSTYWLDNAFSRRRHRAVPALRLRASTTSARSRSSRRSCRTATTSTSTTARRSRSWRWRPGPFCNAVYEIADADRYPVGEAVNFSKLPIDFGIIHYASDTPYTQARTLGARGLSLLRHGLDLRLVAGDPAPHPAPRGRAGLAV